MELTPRDEIMRRLTDTGSPAPTPPGGWTPENVGPELGRLLREAQPIMVPLPPGYPIAEMTFHGDARPLAEYHEGVSILVGGSPYRVTAVERDGDRLTYRLEATWLDQPATRAAHSSHSATP